MSNAFTILIDRLRGGQTQKIEEILDSEFLAIEEPELYFSAPVAVRGEAYLTDDHLILKLKAKAIAMMPCAICNEMIKVELNVEDFYHTQPIQEIPSGQFDFSEALREALLIELPKYIECNGGNCPERATLAPYLRPKEREEKTTYLPFNDIDEQT